MSVTRDTCTKSTTCYLETKSYLIAVRPAVKWKDGEAGLRGGKRGREWGTEEGRQILHATVDQ